MTDLMKKLGLALFAAGAIVAGAASAQAAEDLTVNTDQSQIITLERSPATIVVGNPSIADVTIQGKMIYVHGRVFGKTNIIALDENGQHLAEFAVNVVVNDDYSVVVFKAGAMGTARESYTCKTNCESVFQIGDSLDYYKLISSQQNDKLKIAQGQKSGDDPANNGQAPSGPAQ